MRVYHFGLMNSPKVISLSLNELMKCLLRLFALQSYCINELRRGSIIRLNRIVSILSIFVTQTHYVYDIWLLKRKISLFF